MRESRFKRRVVTVIAVAILAVATIAGTSNRTDARDVWVEEIEQPRLIELPRRAERPEPSNQRSSARPQFTVTLAGDTGYSPHGARVNPRTSTKYGKTLTFAQAFAGIKPDVNGDLNFVNVETIITARNDLRIDSKGQKRPFSFKSHPNGFLYLVSQGVNLFSLANNHSMDFGVAGLRETLRYMPMMQKRGLKAYAGIGFNREEASRPTVVEANGAKVAFAAMGIVTNNLARHRAGDDKPGQIAYRFPEDERYQVTRILEPVADYRMLSIHYGYEGKVRTDKKQLDDWRLYADEGVDLVVGHHAHVVRGVEMREGGGLIFYGLGNFMHHGTANITGNHVCRTHGLFARVHVAQDDAGRWRTRAVEAIPITDTHIAPRRFGSKSASHLRVHALNYLAETIDDRATGARGLRFTPMPDGSGLYCVPGAEDDGGRIGTLCRGWRSPPAIPRSLRRQITSSCAR